MKKRSQNKQGKSQHFTFQFEVLDMGRAYERYHDDSKESHYVPFGADTISLGLTMSDLGVLTCLRLYQGCQRLSKVVSRLFNMRPRLLYRSLETLQNHGLITYSLRLTNIHTDCTVLSTYKSASLIEKEEETKQAPLPFLSTNSPVPKKRKKVVAKDSARKELPADLMFILTKWFSEFPEAFNFYKEKLSEKVLRGLIDKYDGEFIKNNALKCHTWLLTQPNTRDAQRTLVNWINREASRDEEASYKKQEVFVALLKTCKTPEEVERRWQKHLDQCERNGEEVTEHARSAKDNWLKYYEQSRS